MADVVRVFAPGRVNLIGDHTDYSGGRALPMAIELGITIEGTRGGGTVELTSPAEPDEAVVALDVGDPSKVEPRWARYVAGVVAELRPVVGFRGKVTSTLPVGAGLSSSAALEVALALALGADAGDGIDVLAVARLCQRAEQRGSGVPCGLMDQLTSLAAVEGHALAIDFAADRWTPVPLPGDLAVWIVPSGVTRALAGSEYGDRRAECDAATSAIGPLPRASVQDAEAIADPVLRRRARHVVTENGRVDAMVDALRGGDLRAAGRLLLDSHRSLRDDFDVSLPAIDDLVDAVIATAGVHGARLTGAGFGGTVVAFASPGADLASFGARRVHASEGAIVTQAGS